MLNIGHFLLDSVWETLINSHVIFLIIPVLDERGSDLSVRVSCEASKNGSLRDSPPTYISERSARALMVVSGRETSLPRTKIPFEVSALHMALMVFPRNSSCAVVV